MPARSAKVPPAWLDEIKGFVTLGSPSDKHRLMWGVQNFPADIPWPQKNKIRWWNFWDYSDPVGHSLDGIFPTPGAPANRPFERVFDAGFARYRIPGVAHVDYWMDVNIYHRIIQIFNYSRSRANTAGYGAWQMETGSRWWGQWWLMRAGDLLTYGLGRAAAAGAMVYFLSRLTAPVRDGLLARLPALELARSWPTGFLWLNPAIWVLGAAGLWKFVWDILLFGFQDRKLNLGSPLRVERVAIGVWGRPTAGGRSECRDSSNLSWAMHDAQELPGMGDRLGCKHDPLESPHHREQRTRAIVALRKRRHGVQTGLKRANMVPASQISILFGSDEAPQP